MTDSLALRLPVELLLEIFKLAADDDKDDLGAKTAFRLAAVCQAWRALLLDYGPAWSMTSLARIEVTEIMLQRSRTASISLRIDLRFATNHRELERRVVAARLALSRALGRTKELYIAGRQPALISQVMTMLTALKPSLEVFELSAYEPGHMSVYSLIPAHLTGNMPLRRLSLQSTHLSEGAGLILHQHCNSLVHLELHTIQGLSLPALLDLLSAARDTLQTIMMESMALSGLADVPVQQIHLPALRLLSFKGLYPPFRHGTPVAVLPHITYPPTTCFTMHMHVTHASLTPGIQDLPYAHLSSRNLDYKSALLSPIEAPRQPGLRLRCWASRAVPDYFNLDQRPPAPLDLRVTRGADTPDAVAVAALSALGAAANIGSVRRLAVVPLRPDVPWARILSRAPQLNELSIYGPAVVDNLLLACAARNEASAPYGPGEFSLSSGFLNRLSTLNIFGLNLVRASSPSTYPPLDSQHSALTSLLSILPRRVEELCVCYCDARATDMDLLAPLVNGERIVWDGSTNGTSSIPLSMHPRAVSARAAGQVAGGIGMWGGMDDDDWGLGGGGGGGGGGGLAFGFGFGGHNQQQQQPVPPGPAPAIAWHHPQAGVGHHDGHHHILHAHHHHWIGGAQPAAEHFVLGGGLQPPADALFPAGVAQHQGAIGGTVDLMPEENIIGEINPATLINPEAVAAAEQQAQALDEALAMNDVEVLTHNAIGQHVQFLMGHIQAINPNAQGQQVAPPLAPVFPAPAPPAQQDPEDQALLWQNALAHAEAAAHAFAQAHGEAMHGEQPPHWQQ